MDLLEKASIILTPTAYNNGEALCVKPSDGSGDFDFSRNSAATRVNAQGLVENVQILSSNLVQNGDFSEEGVQEVSNGSFSQEGAELVTNGSFDTDSNWNKQTSNWTISNGYAVCDGLQTTNSSLFQDLAVVNGNSYRIDFTITDSANDLNLILGATTIGQYGDGTHTVYVEKDSGGARIFFQATASNAFQGSIDNVSVREVGQDWDLGTGWSIGEDKAEFDGVSNANLTQSNILTNGKQYKLTYEILENTTTSGYIRLGAETATAITQLDGAVGTHEMYFLNDGYTTSFVIRTNSLTGGDFSITNISVKEVGQNWSFTSGATLTDIGAKITHTPTAGSIAQSSVLTIGKQYKLTYEITESISGGLKFNSAVDTSMVTTVGVHTKYFEADGTTAVIGRTSSTDNDVTITNISVIEITDDTNLPRINYEGFSYQDALGSEEITGGDFLNPSDWGLAGGSPPTITNNKLNLIGDTYNSIASNVGASLVSGKTYKVSFEITDYTSGGATFRLGGVFGVSKSGLGVHTQYIVSDGATIRLYSSENGTDLSLTNVSVKEYLGQEVVPDSGCGSWLFEPQSTNLITQSELFSDAIWLNSNSTDTSNYGISPDGLNNSTRFLTTANTGSFLYINSLPILDATNYTLSFWVKSNGNSLDKFRLYTTTGGTSLEFTSTNKWVRYEYNFLSTGTTTNLGIRGVVGQETDVQIWGAQFEQQTYATSYIPTSGTSVTRNQDVCTNGGSLASINSTEGVLYAEIAALADTITDRHMISISDGTTSNSVFIRFGNASNVIEGRSRIGGANVGITNFIVSDETEFHKIAYKWKLNDYALWVDGVEVGTSTGVVASANTFNTLNFNNGSGSQIAEGKVKAVAVWKEALSDSELQSLTTI